MNNQSREDILLWSDGFWLFRSEHYDYNERCLSDEFVVLYFESAEWYDFVSIKAMG